MRQIVVGRLKSFRTDNEFGFAKLPDGRDALVKMRDLLPTGMLVIMEVEETERGLRALRVLGTSYAKRD